MSCSCEPPGMALMLVVVVPESRSMPIIAPSHGDRQNKNVWCAPGIQLDIDQRKACPRT
jgi:hypothetical protein